MKVNFKPLNNNVLIKLPEIKETTNSGIIKSEAMLAEEKKSKQDYFTVVAVSAEVTCVKIGDLILVANHSIPIIIIEGLQYGIIHYTSIQGVKI